MVRALLVVGASRLTPLVSFELAISVALTAAITLLVVHRLVERLRGDDSAGRRGFTDHPRPPNERPRSAEHSDDASSPTVLTDEDRVLRMLESNGGRVRQMTIVEETDWSKSKVSRLLTSMEEQGVIEKVSVGRENVITLNGLEGE